MIVVPFLIALTEAAAAAAPPPSPNATAEAPTADASFPPADAAPAPPPPVESPAPAVPPPAFLPPAEPSGPTGAPPVPVLTRPGSDGRRRAHLVFKVAGFGYYERMYVVNTYGGGGGVRIGWGKGPDSLYLDAGAEFIGGRTEHGLGIAGVGAGAGIEYPLAERLRLGIAGRGTLLTIERATFNRGYPSERNDVMHALSVGIQPHVSVDLVRPRQDDGVFLQGSFYLSPQGVGPRLSIGYRFEATR